MYTLAANQGHVSAQSHLGNMYAQGNGVEKNYIEALKWFKLAANQGDNDSKKMIPEVEEKISLGLK